tara:strand:- start:742 stop:1197 length:456 start_codon:yes stop_codon:yes gene_type:complete
MTFLKSIKTCLFKKYFIASGRANRSEYWYFMLFVYSIILLAGMSRPILQELTPQDQFSSTKDWSIHARTFINIFYFIIAIPYITSTSRRLQDIGQSNTWVLFIVLFWLLSLIPFFILSFLSIIGSILQIIVFILCTKKGDKKKNKFGAPSK